VLLAIRIDHAHNGERVRVNGAQGTVSRVD
jgi:hypothetical protein